MEEPNIYLYAMSESYVMDIEPSRALMVAVIVSLANTTKRCEKMVIKCFAPCENCVQIDKARAAVKSAQAPKE